jgi:hypothetical protein
LLDAFAILFEEFYALSQRTISGKLIFEAGLILIASAGVCF